MDQPALARTELFRMTAEQVRTARTRAKLTQARAGEMIGASAKLWGQWESGYRNMPQAKWELFKLRAAKM